MKNRADYFNLDQESIVAFNFKEEQLESSMLDERIDRSLGKLFRKLFEHASESGDLLPALV